MRSIDSISYKTMTCKMVVKTVKSSICAFNIQIEVACILVFLSSELNVFGTILLVNILMVRETHSFSKYQITLYENSLKDDPI